MSKPANTVLLHYAHPETGQTVLIQGMVHVAPSAFFRSVNTNIKQFLADYPDNGLVLLEKVQPETADETEQAGLKQQISHIMSRIMAVEDFSLERAYQAVADLLGVESQFGDSYLNGIPADKTEIADMSAEQFIACLNAQPAIAELIAQEPFKYKYRMATLEKWARFPLFRRPAAWLIKRGLRAVLKASDPDGNLKSERKIGFIKIETDLNSDDAEAHDKAFMEVVQQERNRLLIAKLERRLAEGRNLFITYGAAHFQAKQQQQFDVLAFLEAHGFKRVSRRDMEVF
ncbi:MAG: TraB/GumN family protein [Neisseria sp.]|nr:TraB/GumN family protein [Neisseria sp.]